MPDTDDEAAYAAAYRRARALRMRRHADAAAATEATRRKWLAIAKQAVADDPAKGGQDTPWKHETPAG